ncbi:MAG: hypothetical protein WCI66_09545 [Gammaproteobacteria bacterium]
MVIIVGTDASWGLLDVCESTPGQDSLDAYLHRKALSGRDERRRHAVAVCQ